MELLWRNDSYDGQGFSIMELDSRLFWEVKEPEIGDQGGEHWSG